MRNFLFALLFTCFSAATHAQLLYRISGNGLQRPSYIVGTYHLAPASFADSIPGLRTVQEQCEQVYGELEINALLNPDSTALVQQAMLLPEGMKLSQILTPDEMKRVKDYTQKKFGFTASILMQQAEGMTPMGLVTEFEILNSVMKIGQIDISNVLDIYLQRYALVHGKKTGGLESLSLQMNVLYQGKSMERQKQLLLCLVDHSDFDDMMTDSIIKSYFAQDLEGVKNAMDMKLENDCDNTPDEEEQVISGRNANWMVQMPAIMQAKSTLFVVGAGHLPGEKGVLNLLRQAGYQVEACK